MRITLKWLNWAFFFAGMVIVWSATHNWAAMVGVWIAAIHFTSD